MNICHDLIQKAMNFNDAAIVSVKANDYRIQFLYMNKDDEIHIMNNFNLNETWIIINFYTIYKKCVKKLIIKETKKQY